MLVDPRVQGVDFQVDLTALDFVMSPQAGLATVAGSDNVAGAILRRLDTPLGDLIAHKSFGNAAWDRLDDPMTTGWGDRYQADIRTCLAQEPRITLLGVSLVIDYLTSAVRTTVTYQELARPGRRNLVWTANLIGVRQSVRR